jgi:uracil-DNA glycosylase family 4
MTTLDEKRRLYSSLVSDRKVCERCAAIGLTNPSRIQSGAFDSAEIGPWTRWNGDLDARILVVGQEWGDIASLERQCGIDTASKTNEMLRELLDSVGVSVASAPTSLPASGVFLTNAALCLKVGGAQATVKKDWFVNCGSSFLRRQVEIVDPLVVVALGECAYRALRHAFDLPNVIFSDSANRRLPIPLRAGASLVVVYHCGQRMLNTHRKRDAHFEDWQLVKRLLNTKKNHGG